MSCTCVRSFQKLVISRSFLSTSTTSLVRETKNTRVLQEAGVKSNENLRNTFRKTQSEFPDSDSFGTLKSYSKRAKKFKLKRIDRDADTFGTLSIPETFKNEDEEKVKEVDRLVCLSEIK